MLDLLADRKEAEGRMKMAAERFSKARLLKYLKQQEQKKAGALKAPATEGVRQMLLTQRMLLHELIKKVVRNQFGSDL